MFLGVTQVKKYVLLARNMTYLPVSDQCVTSALKSNQLKYKKKSQAMARSEASILGHQEVGTGVPGEHSLDRGNNPN